MGKVKFVRDVVEMAIGETHKEYTGNVVVAFAYEGGAFRYHHCSESESKELLQEFKEDGTITLEYIIDGEYNRETFVPDIAFILKTSEVWVKREEIIQEVDV